MTCNNSTTKICTQCPGDKALSCFSPDKRAKDGLMSLCNNCCNEVSKKYQRTKKGLIARIYSSQRSHSLKRKHLLPIYDLAELRCWALNKTVFHELFNKWVLSDYKKELSPSFDRINDYRSYSLDNLRIVTWKENLEKSHSDVVNGINNKKSKAVVQLNIDDTFIAEYCSLAQAERVTNINRISILRCCKETQNIAGGYKWAYA